MENKFINDISFGLGKEIQLENSIKTYFNFKHINKLSKFHCMDYNCENDYIELKSRRFNHNKYETTMIGINKIQFAQSNKDKNIYFLFAFDDGCYMYKFDSNDKFETTIGGRQDRGKKEYKLYYYIPITSLVKIFNIE